MPSSNRKARRRAAEAEQAAAAALEAKRRRARAKRLRRAPRPDDPALQVIDIDEQWYFKPDAGRLMASPADETPSPPTDAQPEELDASSEETNLGDGAARVVEVWLENDDGERDVLVAMGWSAGSSVRERDIDIARRLAPGAEGRPS